MKCELTSHSLATALESNQLNELIQNSWTVGGSKIHLHPQLEPFH